MPAFYKAADFVFLADYADHHKIWNAQTLVIPQHPPVEKVSDGGVQPPRLPIVEFSYLRAIHGKIRIVGYVGSELRCIVGGIPRLPILIEFGEQ